MKESKADLLLHPIRMKIIQALVGERKLTVEDMRSLLPDVPQASLYRHLKKLVDGNVIYVVEENKVRGTVERQYALYAQGGEISESELASATKEDWMTYFLKYVFNLVGDFDHYLQQETIDAKQDGVGFRQTTLHLTPKEFNDFIQDMRSVIQKYMAYEPSADRRTRTFATINIPRPYLKGEDHK